MVIVMVMVIVIGIDIAITIVTTVWLTIVIVITTATVVAVAIVIFIMIDCSIDRRFRSSPAILLHPRPPGPHFVLAASAFQAEPAPFGSSGRRPPQAACLPPPRLLRPLDPRLLWPPAPTRLLRPPDPPAPRLLRPPAAPAGCPRAPFASASMWAASSRQRMAGSVMARRRVLFNEWLWFQMGNIDDWALFSLEVFLLLKCRISNEFSH